MSVIEEGSAADAVQIERALLDSLRGDQPQACNSELVRVLRTADGQLVGGITGSTSYGWLLIKTLWVAPDQRGRGAGAMLMQSAEQTGRERGCHAAWLDTSNAQAKSFYTHLGYTEFGLLGNTPDQHPASHRRWFLHKLL